MPYETATTPFTGDNDLNDFMANVWIPFARDECKWADNQAPTTSPERNRYWTHRVERGGSPVADLSPFTPKPPFIFFEVSDDGRHMAHYTGDGIDTTKQGWNQPGQPNNYWNVNLTDDGAGTSYVNGYGILSNDIIGTYQKYWLFSDEEGRYIHCVIQPRAREYRHFHIGLLTPLHPELDPDSFYITGHFWSDLYSRFTSDSNESDNQKEHAPYISNHRIPFTNYNGGFESFGLPKPEWNGTMFYMPGVYPNSPTTPWFFTRETESTDSDIGSYANDSAVVGSPVGEGQDRPPAYGVANCNGYGPGLGNTLWACDKTFTSNTNSLVPIYVAANTIFSSLNRYGVVAQIPDVYRINMRDYSPGEEITVGSDTYVVFPAINDDAANVLDGEGYSGYEGYAYKKITATVP